MGVPVRGAGSTNRHQTHVGKAQRDSEVLLRLELESNPEALCLVRATVERAAEVLKFPDGPTRAIVRSVDEALANVMRHAYAGRGGMPITMTCRRIKPKESAESGWQGMEILLEDEGEAIDPTKLKGRSLEEIRPGGLGLHFIRQSMDEVEFSRKKGKNQLRMVKYLASPPQATEAEGE